MSVAILKEFRRFFLTHKAVFVDVETVEQGSGQFVFAELAVAIVVALLELALRSGCRGPSSCGIRAC